MWRRLGLHVDAYDRLQRAILEVHATHPLADEMRRYGPYSLQVQAFLEVVRDTLLTAGETLGSAVQPCCAPPYSSLPLLCVHVYERWGLIQRLHYFLSQAHQPPARLMWICFKEMAEQVHVFAE